MTFKNVCRAVLLCGVLSTANASVLKLADVLVSNVNLKRKIISSGVTGSSINSLKGYVDNSVESLMKGSRSKDLYQVIKGLRVERGDVARRASLLSTLRKPSSQVTSEQFTKAVNDLVILSDRYGVGNGGMLSCSVCVSEQLSLLNFKASMKKVGNKKIKKVLERVPTSPQRLSLFLKRRARRMGVKDTFRYVKPEEERTLGLFLELGRRGDKDLKEFVSNVIEFNKVGKSSVLVGPEAPSKLWKIVASKTSDDKISKWNKVLKVSLKESDPAKRQDAFYNELIRLADGDADKIEDIKQLRSNNCFFK